jgi:hypothetical protein
MKRITLALAVIVLATATASAQIRLNAYGGYVFNENVDSYYENNASSRFSGKIKGGFQWGTGIEFNPRQDYGIELVYFRQDTKGDPWTYRYNSSVAKVGTIDLGINYIMLGGLKYVRNNPKVEPYGGAMLGMAIFSSQIENETNAPRNTLTKFAWGFRGGVNIWASEKVGIKLQAMLMSAVQSMGAGLTIGTGGVGVGAASYSSMYQFTLGGGLTFKLGQAAGAARPAMSPVVR